jgi:hypothetical protein
VLVNSDLQDLLDFPEPEDDVDESRVEAARPLESAAEGDGANADSDAGRASGGPGIVAVESDTSANAATESSNDAADEPAADEPADSNWAASSEEAVDLQQLVDRFASSVDGISASIQQLTTITADQGVQLSQVKDRLVLLEEQLNENIRRQSQILEAISQPDSAGNQILRLDGIMQRSEQFRRQMSDAVHQSIRDQGEFVVVNKMDTEQSIRVNQKQYTVRPGAVLALKVPVGTVSTRLPGQRLQNWTVSTPAYYQSVDIVPEETPTPVAETAHAVTVFKPETTTAYYVEQPASGTVAYSVPTTTFSPIVASVPATCAPTTVYSPVVSPTVAYYPSTTYTSYYPTSYTSYYPSTSYDPYSTYYYPSTYTSYYWPFWW